MPVGVPPRTDNIEKQGDESKERKKPVEQVEAAGVEAGAVQPPAAPAVARGGAVDHLDEEAPEPRRDAEDAEEDGAADGLHAGGGLAVEELEQADEGSDVHHAQQKELRRQPEHRHLRGCRGAPAPAPAFHHGRHRQRHHVGCEPDADALQVRDAARVPRRTAQPRHHRAVIYHQDQHLEHDRDHEEARRRHVGGAEAGVHGRALLHREGEEQWDREVAEDRADEDGQHAQDDLDLLHLRHRAQRPAPRRVTLLYGRLVKEPFNEARQQVVSQSLHLRSVASSLCTAGCKWPIYLKDSCEGAPRGLLVPVEWQAGDEDDGAKERNKGREHEADAPSLVVLQPHHEDQPHEAAERDAEGEPVEEADLAPELLWVVAVELVAAQRRRAHPYCALADGDHVQAQGEQAQVTAAHRRALVRVVDDIARWRVQRREVRLAC
ncbi:hypothetical protein U9M48_035618 [Paspalum notatum var. saurae]|uniref:Uncharacterized protein n=1 Tax=Paspalum notatum var. saurae TaxID=547442 RepID=A0AAQ3X8L4_PASNO